MPNPSSSIHNDSAHVEQLRDSVNAYCSRALPPRRLRELRTLERPFDFAIWREMAELGWLGLIIPEAHSGLALGGPAVVMMCRELGRVVAAEPYIESGIVCAGLLTSLERGGPHLELLLRGVAVYTCPLRAREWRDFARIQATAEGTI